MFFSISFKCEIWPVKYETCSYKFEQEKCVLANDQFFCLTFQTACYLVYGPAYIIIMILTFIKYAFNHFLRVHTKLACMARC